MNTSRSSSVLTDEELRLPRTPGVIRRYWARHPRLADVLIVLACFVLSVAPNGAVRIATTQDGTLLPGPPPPLGSVIAVTAATLSACLLLMLRRRSPLIVFLAAYAASLVDLLLLQSSTGLLLIIASYSLAVYRPSRAAWTAFGIGMGAYTLTALALWAVDAIARQDAVATVSGQLVLTLIGTLIGTNVGGRKRYLEALIDRSRQLLVERDQQGQIAAAAERARIAREMHDIVSHSLTVVVALSEGAAATDDRTRARDASLAAAATARGALTEMRQMLGVLRDGDTDAPLTPSEPVSPQATVESAQRAGYPVTLAVKGTAEVCPSVGFAISRIVQEGVTNAMRHASGALRIAVRIAHTDGRIVVEIENDGARGRPGTSGFGIRGLQERAAHVGGSLVSGPAGDGRWMLRADLPSAAPHEEEPDD